MDQQSPASPMSTVCTQCNTTVLPGQTVCTNCGSQLFGGPPASKMSTGAIIAIVCGVLFGGVIIVGILASMLLPSLAKAKGKANRIKCQNNLKTINMAFNNYSTEDEGQTPHLSSSFAPVWTGQSPTNSSSNATEVHNARARAMGYSSWLSPQRGSRWMQAYPIRQSLSHLSVLASPLDQKAIAAQRRNVIKTFDQWKSSDYSQYVRRNLQSYAIAMQGDLEAAETVLALTRNIRGGSHSAYYRRWGGYRNDENRWLFPHYPIPYEWHVYRAHLQVSGVNHVNEFYGPGSQKFSMTGLATDQGNWLTSGGATAQGSDSEFNDQLRMSDKNFSEGVVVTSRPSLTILRPYQ